MCMDLTAAFDLVTWPAIKEALEMAHIDPSIQEVLLQWLSQVRYVFKHKNLEKELWPSWGLRQGCIGSPVLWSAFTALLCPAMEIRLEAHWSKNHMTMYADDSHLRWVFSTVPEFERAIQELKVTFAVFAGWGCKQTTSRRRPSSHSPSKAVCAEARWQSTTPPITGRSFDVDPPCGQGRILRIDHHGNQ